ncbi:MAG TPA: hypothetical protein VGA40_09095, partial [Candidatus Acidoferrales bacterium]
MRNRNRHNGVLLAGAALLLALATFAVSRAPAQAKAQPRAQAQAQTPAKNTCLDCHAMLDGALQVTAERFTQDIHFQKRLNCASCHGGNPSVEDMELSMSRAAGFRGKI